MDRTHAERRLNPKNGHRRKMEMKWTRGRPRQMMLGWMMTDGLTDGYRRLNDKHSRTFKPALKRQRTRRWRRREKSIDVMECYISAFEGVLFHCGLISVSNPEMHVVFSCWVYW